MYICNVYFAHDMQGNCFSIKNNVLLTIKLIYDDIKIKTTFILCFVCMHYCITIFYYIFILAIKSRNGRIRKLGDGLRCPLM